MEKRKMVIVITNGLDNERSSVAWSIANGAINAGLDLTVFLVSSAVDWVRKGAADNVHLNPLDPTMKEMIDNVLKSGSRVGVCPPCAKVRGYVESDLLDGVEVVGSMAIHEPVLQGAATLTF
ncbi:DsrE family protein [Paracrocinitomix mangrovi]|uniref:DsrE family protein n=1 Tax=Paracrocinitomix mangrovi TaxID=2862509 RepID=UPI001C8DD6DF|nr:DsrE family protein [Paracrocinitomix mangrovi]UKN00447.1 DsrE family protein [Paracrocinitomix mangrovi]